VCLIDTEAAWTVGENGYASKSANCSFDGMRLRGRVLLTIAGGVIAHRQPMLVASDGGAGPRATGARNRAAR
jgi:dihydroorotase-like cyclic amidohydrolase